MFIRSNNRTHPHFHTTDDISSLILRAPAGRYCISLFRSKRIRDRVRYVTFSMLLSKHGDASQYSNWLHSNIWFIHFFAYRLFISSFHLFLLIRFLLHFHMLFFCTFVSLFYSYCSSFFCFFLYSRIIVYRSIMCQINRKMKFNARIDKLNVNLY